MGRTRLTPQQQQQLMGDTPASRICDLLLTLGSIEERIALLPDCFTPPAEDEAAEEAADGSSSAAAEQQQQQQGEEEQETEELWCTPMQLLNEIEARLKAAAAASNEGSSSSSRQALGLASSSSNSGDMPFGGTQMQQQQYQLPEASSGSAAADVPEGMLVGDAAVAALRELRDHISSCWPQHYAQAEQQ